ncbi:MAG: asparaginase [Cyclobacteriaceae bacterium]|nr:asparaginase [Cyclobacteriaceae bacterium]
MKYTTLTIDTALPARPRAKVMIIYTGGTFGMVRDASGVLKPFDFSAILEHLPTLRNLMLQLTVISFDNPIDSSDIEPGHWLAIADIIEKHYEGQDGFVVLHGTDTMAYTSSALAFMLRNLSKPVVFTGAQLPISESRSDARENLITALEIASASKGSQARVPEVCVYFDYALIRGCRAKKVESMHFDAFQSENYPHLAKAGVSIDYNEAAIFPPSPAGLAVWKKFDRRVAVLKLFPGITEETVAAVVRNPNLKGLIIETYGSGNAPTAGWFLSLLKEAIAGGLLVLNISQCPGGMVVQGKYETSRGLQQIGVIGGADMTIEAAVTKLMLLLGEFGVEGARQRIGQSLAGELSA